MDPAELLRAVRFARRLSQRELAAAAGVPRSTVDRIESGRVRDPGLATIEALLNAVAYHFLIVNQHGRPLRLDPDRSRPFDRAGRHFPAHLEWNRVVSPLPVGLKFDWWGWGKIAWSISDPIVPKYTYWRRRDVTCWPYADWRRDDAT